MKYVIQIEITEDQVAELCEENEKANWPTLSTALTQALQFAIDDEPRSEDLPNIPAKFIYRESDQTQEPCDRFESQGRGPNGDHEHSLFCRNCHQEFCDHDETAREVKNA